MNEGIYYLRLNGKVEGPFSIGQIYDLWAARKINSQTLFARFEEMDKWQPLSELTLKISAPKLQQPKAPAYEPPLSHPAKAKTPPVSRTEEFPPPPPFKAESKPQPAVTGRRPFAAVKAIFSNPSSAIRLWIIVGVLVLVYAMLYAPTSAEGREPDSRLVIQKLSGVIAGVGLILMGGLLTVAHQFALLLNMLKGDSPGKESPKNRPQPPRPSDRT